MYKSILITFLIIASSGPGYAQLGGIKNTIKSKTTKETKENDPPKTKPGESLSSAQEGGAGGLLDHVLMDYINFNYDNPRIFIEQARAMHLGSDGSDVKVTMKIKDSGAKTFATYESNAQAPKRNKSFWMSGFSGVGGTEPAITLPGAGDYYLEFSSGGKVFDRFPFTLRPHTGDKGQSWFLMDGIWNDHAMIDTSGELIFHIWMRDMLEGTGRRGIDYGKFSAKIVREKDGKLIGRTSTSAENATLAPMRKWTRYKITFVNGPKQAAIGIYDVTVQDGAYHVEFMHDGRVYGKYPFSVKGGKLQGVSEFGGTPLETQDGDLTWMKREGGRL